MADDFRIDAPNDVPLSRLSGNRRDESANTRKLIQEGVEIAFHIPKHFGGGPHWPLADDEAKLLAGRIDRFLASLPSRQAKRWKKFIDKHMPGISLVAAAATITIPRVLDTVEYRKAYARATQVARNVAAPTTAVHNGTAHRNGSASIVASPADERSVAGANGVPLSRAEIDGFFGGDFG